tara:strand:+ start:1310 stop:1630 length:321 start_codon:yes stop_codon:yes gene_type:complete
MLKKYRNIVIHISILFFLLLIVLHYVNPFKIIEGNDACSPSDRGDALSLFKTSSKLNTYNNRMNSNILKLEREIIKNEKIIKKSGKKSENDSDKNLSGSGINKKKL